MTAPASSGESLPTAENPYTFAPQLVTLSNTPDPRGEAIRALRTHVVAQHLHKGRRALAVCAASPGVGCTFIAANLAVSLSQIGVKTLLIDADLHNPSVEALIRPSHPGKGLAHCLAIGDADVYPPIHADVLPNLSVLFAGGAAADAQELLGAERFQALMAICLRDFDATIVDTPPANRYSDARRVSTVVGYSLIVAARDKTYINDVKTLAAQLQTDHARVVGTVLNRA